MESKVISPVTRTNSTNQSDKKLEKNQRVGHVVIDSVPSSKTLRNQQNPYEQSFQQIAQRRRNPNKTIPTTEENYTSERKNSQTKTKKTPGILKRNFKQRIEIRKKVKEGIRINNTDGNIMRTIGALLFSLQLLEFIRKNKKKL